MRRRCKVILYRAQVDRWFISIEGTATTLHESYVAQNGSHFAQDNAPLLNIPGRTHPVEIVYTSEPERDAV